jgi:hypothetical protein
MAIHSIFSFYMEPRFIAVFKKEAQTTTNGHIGICIGHQVNSGIGI